MCSPSHVAILTPEVAVDQGAACENEEDVGEECKLHLEGSRFQLGSEV